LSHDIYSSYVLMSVCPGGYFQGRYPGHEQALNGHNGVDDLLAKLDLAAIFIFEITTLIVVRS
jgi:hypothetical protein